MSTMYAIKKVETSNTTNSNTSGIAANNNNNSELKQNSSNTAGNNTSNNNTSNSASPPAVWQKKKRKRGGHRSRNHHKKAPVEAAAAEQEREDDDSSLGKSDDLSTASAATEPTHSHNHHKKQALTATELVAGAQTKNTKEKSTTPAAVQYDPKSNPYSLENYKKNRELQQKVKTASTTTTIKLLTSKSVGGVSSKQEIRTDNLGLSKSPMSQVRLTPLFPSPQISHTTVLSTVTTPNNNGHGRLPPTLSSHAMGGMNHASSHSHTPHVHHSHTPHHHQQQQQQHAQQQHQQHQQQQHQHQHQQHHNGPPRDHYHHVHHAHHNSHHSQIQRLNHVNPADTDPTQCPHGNLSAEELINIKIRKRNVCYVVGLPIHIATEEKLRSQEWFGQFGNIATIAINRNSKSIQANSIPAHITYDNDISALNAINFCNKFVFDDGRKLKATFGTQHYCRWFIAANKKCTNVFCGFRHSWCRPEDIITQKDINDFKAIPAGAYTSRNIENQPLGIRSTGGNASSSDHQHQYHHTTNPNHANNQQPPPATHTLNIGGGAQNVVPVYTNVYQPAVAGAATLEDDKYLRLSHVSGISPLDGLTTADITSSSVFTATPTLTTVTNGTSALSADPLLTSVLSSAAATALNGSMTASNADGLSNTNGSNKPPNIQTMSADPYTFYLSNAAATPTGPSPLAAPAIPNIYDSRHVLMKQIMNRNHSQQAEIDRLTQQIKILSEMEIKNKQEIHRWWTELAQSQQNEKNLKAKYEKLSNDFKSLESKHDNLQIKYLALDEKYKRLLDSKSAETKEFESWDSDDVVKWIMNLDNKKYKRYEDPLAKNIIAENIDGQCLESLDKGDLHRLGVTDFKDKKDLLQKIKELVTPKDS